MTEQSRTTKSPETKTYEPPRIKDLGSLRELTLGNKSFPQVPDNSYGIPFGS